MQDLRVLVADDDETDRTYISSKIASWGCITEAVSDGQQALDRYAEFRPHVIVSDVRMPRLTGLELIGRLNELGAAPPVILLTQFGGIEAAVAAVRDAGAFWFLEKPAPPGPLHALISRAARLSMLTKENGQLRDIVAHQETGDLTGSHPKMLEIYDLIRRIAPTQATVLITGESGTGKDVAAKTIHALSPRVNGPFEAVNCAALPESLIESELFGHEKGAFTGAHERRMGRIEAADGGTLFLDEIGELAPQLQAKLLRVLEDSRVRRLGGKTESTVNIRLLAATNRDPEEAIRAGQLREDLFYRLSVFRIDMPPLRERAEDIPALAACLLRRLAPGNHARQQIASDVAERLMQYSWPGNVRELKNVLERASILCGDRPLEVRHLPPHFARSQPAGHETPATTPPPLCAAWSPADPAPNGSTSVLVPLGVTMAEAERKIILGTFEYAGRNRQRTASVLGLSRRTIQSRLQEYFKGNNRDRDEDREARSAAV